MTFPTPTIIWLLSIYLLCVLLSACAGADYRPVIDTKGQDMSNFETDLSECQGIAREDGVVDDVAKSAAVGAATGAVIGGVISAMAGDPGAGALVGAGYGATAGSVDGTISGTRDQKQIVVNCMLGRGYKVLK
jgi:outer membrane lipoprotein SlyB